MSDPSETPISKLLRRAMALRTGVAWYGPLRHIGGYGNATRAYLAALARAGVAVHAVDIGLDHAALLPAAEAAALAAMTRASCGPRPIEVLHTQPPAYPQLGRPFPVARVAVHVFETLSLPLDWVIPLNAMDAIWLPSEHHRRCYVAAGVDADKIRVVPYAIDTGFFRPQPKTTAKRAFRFGYASVWDARKGVDLLIRAFVDEFSADEDVELVIQTSIPDVGGDDAHREALRRLAAAAPADPRVIVQTTPLDQRALRDFYGDLDVYVSTDRHVNWTLPCMEALAMGVPCATPDYAREVRWLDDNPLQIRCAPALADTDPALLRLRSLYSGQRWPTYDVSDVRRVLRWAFTERAALARLAESGRAFVEQHHGIDVIARALRAALDAVPIRRPRLRRSRLEATWRGEETLSGASIRRRLREVMRR